MELLFLVVPLDLKLGLIITIVGITVVFTALMVLSILFNQIPRLLKLNTRIKLRKSGKKNEAEQGESLADISGDTNAAIALALHLYMNDFHDVEPKVMTIANVSKRYSPWSSKIYGLRNFPKR